MQPKKLSKSKIQAIIKTAIADAKDNITNTVEKDRLKAIKYFDGKTDLGSEEGRTAVVDTVAQDAVQSVKPVLMRTFMQADKPAEYIPHGQEDVEGAEQATDYAQYVFERSGGYRMLDGTFHDALTQKTGIVKVYWDETETVEIDEYSNKTDDEIALLQFHAELEGEEFDIIESDQRHVASPQGQPITLNDVKVSRKRKGGRIQIDLVAPERFFWDSGAKDETDYYILGHSEDLRVSDLVEMGYDFADVSNLGKEGQEEAEIERQNYDHDNESAGDPSMREVTFTEAYMRMDIEGTGVARLYKFLCAGHQHKLLDYELADDVPFAVYQVDPMPHQFAGRSLIDPIVADQDVGTQLLRGLIDGIHMANNPKTYYRRGAVNVEALQLNEYGGMIDCEDPHTDVVEMAPPNTAVAALPAIQYNNQRISEKTGVSEAALGTNGDFLQAGATVAGVNAAVQGAQSRVEYMARNLAEGHMRLFKLLYRLIRKHVSATEFMRQNGTFAPVDPSDWASEMDVRPNVGLGTGQKAQRIAALQYIGQTQAAVFQTMGFGNPLVSLTKYRNAQADLAALSGVHNFDRYMAPMDEQREDELREQAPQQQQPQQPDPSQSIVQAESIKAQQRDIDSQRKHQREIAALQMEDDRKRDEMDQQRILEAAKILGQHGIAVDQNRIQAMQNMTRY